MSSLESSLNSGQEKQFINIEDYDEAKEFIKEHILSGEWPTVTVKAHHADKLKNGLTRHASWIPGFEDVVGTIGIDPYLPSGEERVVVKVKNLSLEEIEPRFTGADKHFHGVVVLQTSKGIGPEQIEMIKH